MRKKTGLETKIAFSLLEEHFSEVKDYRREASTNHNLLHILFITLCGVISGANNLKEVAEYAKDMEEWFASFLLLPNGIPSYGTFWLVFKHLDPSSLSKHFISWVQAVVKKSKGKNIAIDGKAQRGTASPDTSNSFVHIVSAWSSEEGLTLGQFKVENKSNEITAIPKLLDLIDVEDAVITIDAMGTQKEIAEKIINKKADYILALKGNQSNLQSEVVNFTTQAMKYGKKNKEFELFEQGNKGHGRVENRRIFMSDKIDFLKDFIEEWPGLKSIVWIESERIIKGKIQKEIRHFISSLTPDSEEAGKLIRSHWSIENSAHWILDIVL